MFMDMLTDFKLMFDGHIGHIGRLNQPKHRINLLDKSTQVVQGVPKNTYKLKPA